jgi:urease gamma subunit
LIRVKAIVTGEKDASSFFRTFEYSNESYHTIFLPSVNDIKEKLTLGLRINTNECLALYCDYVVSQLRAQNHMEYIEKGAKTLLSPHSVLIGVPESLRKIVLYAELDKVKQCVITLEEPIKVPHYFLSPTAR